jgi:hypothetical protein
VFQQGPSKCFQDGFKIYKYKSFGSFNHWVSLGLISSMIESRKDEVQYHLVGWNHKNKRDHSESRRELNFPANQIMK